MVPSFCPNCEQPVAVDDRHCDVCNAPLDQYRHHEPGGFTDRNPDLQNQLDTEMARLRAAQTASPIIQSPPLDDSAPLAAFVPPPPEEDTHESSGPQTMGVPKMPNANEDTHESSGPQTMGVPKTGDAKNVGVPNSNEEPYDASGSEALDLAVAHFDTESGSLAQGSPEPKQTIADEAEAAGVESQAGNSSPGSENQEAKGLSQPPASIKLSAKPQPTVVLNPTQDMSTIPNYEPESSLPPLMQEPEPAPRTAGDKGHPSGEFASAPMATPDDVQQQIDSEIIETCQRLHRQGYQMYGLFGRPSTGKSSMIYALRHHFTKGDPGFGGYATEGENWEHLAEDLEAQWQSRQVPTSDRLHPYLALQPRGGGKHIALLDIAGERFEGIQSWTDEIFEFFGLYLAYCQGFFILLELDDLAAADQVGHDARARMQSQMARVVRFLAVAGQMERLKSTADVQAKRAAAEAAVSGTGKVKVRVPVSLCLSKADLVGQMKFGPRLGKVIPGSHSPQSDPWNVLQAIWPEHTRTLLEMVPFLKVDWLSCLGTDFESERQFTGSIGLRSAFQHVVTDPPPRWSLSTANYLKWQKWLRL